MGKHEDLSSNIQHLDKKLYMPVTPELLEVEDIVPLGLAGLSLALGSVKRSCLKGLKQRVVEHDT